MNLAPIPGFDGGLSSEERQAKWKWRVQEARKRHPPTRPVLGAEKVLRAHPKARPAVPKRSPTPRIHTRDPAVKVDWLAK